MKKLLFSLSMCTLMTLIDGAPIQKDSAIIKETFRNNYGIIVSGQDWVKRGSDGTITKILKDGSTLYEVYVQGVLHGEVTLTFPHSTTLAVVKTYDQGRLLSYKTFFPNGLPAKEELFREDGAFTVTLWPDGHQNDTLATPYFTETTYQGLVLEGKYASFNGKYSSSIQNGEGVRSVFSQSNVLLAEEVFSSGVMVKRTTFYPNREPETIVHYADSVPHGLRLTYLPGGIPNTIEEWRYGYQDGMTKIFKNGCKVAEIPFVKGVKEGVELRYDEHESIAEEVSWKNNCLHGIRRIHAGGESRSEWYYRGRLVSQTKFERLHAASS